MRTEFTQGLATYDNFLLGGLAFSMNGRQHLWVHGNYGNNGNEGKAPSEPLLTMARAFQLVESGGVIHFNGNILEQIDTPVGIFDVTVIGEANMPRHADSHTSSSLAVPGGRNSATWKAPASPAATTPLCRVRQQGWRFANILWVPPSDSCAVRVFRDGGADDAERDASHIHVTRCRFAGGQDGIEAHGGPNFVHITDNFFMDQTGEAIKETTGAGIGTNFRWLVAGNRFHSNVNHIVVPMNESLIRDNYFGVFTTMGIDLNGGVGNNVITNNYLAGTYSVAGGYRRAAASDDWGGNWNTGVGVLTTADPA